MNIQEMHQSFRVLAQEMNMEYSRNILPSEIDELLNLSINEKVREVLASNVGIVYQDRISVQDNPISPISYLRTLYKEISLDYNEEDNTISIHNSDGYDVMFYFTFLLSYKDKLDKFFKCRFIEPDRLQETLNDFCIGASYDFPIVEFVKHNRTSNAESDVFKFYIGNDNKQLGKIKIKYLKNPAKVSYDKNISCDLPIYTHSDIVQTACQKYFNSIGYTNNVVNQ